MYFKHCWIENIGAISKLNIEMPFNADGSPKPVVLVGANGAGKTIFLSYMADFLIEVAKQSFQDVVLGQGFQSPFFRLVGNRNQKLGTSHGFCILRATMQPDEGSIFYREQYGETTPESFAIGCSDAYKQQLAWSNNEKHIDNINKEVINKEFKGKSYCFFPHNRYEIAYWQNTSALSGDDFLETQLNLNDHLGEKNIINLETYSKNHNWLLHLFMDAKADFIPTVNEKAELQFILQGEMTELLIKQQSLKNVNKVIQKILGNPQARLALLPRTIGHSRICIAQDNIVIVPSLKHLSAGQAILLNMFLAIIRHSDIHDQNKSTMLEQIEGIVLIDEIDAHIHSDLQYEVLPKLIKIFPKIQFILTSHAPLFVLGMENEFGQDGYALVEMPDGNIISAERFSEFQQSFKYYQQTKSFDDEQRELLKKELQKSTKPLVLTEGNTDPDYIKAAIELLGHTDLMNNIEIEWIGSKRNGQEFFTGDKNLNNAAEFLRANPKFLKNRSILLLYDFDSKKSDEQEGNLWIHSIKKNTDNTKIKKGIENLIPDSLFDPDDERFYSKKEKIGDYGEITIVSDFKKRAFCDYICTERKNPSDFTNFRPLLEFFRQFSSGQSEIEHDTIKP